MYSEKISNDAKKLMKYLNKPLLFKNEMKSELSSMKKSKIYKSMYSEDLILSICTSSATHNPIVDEPYYIYNSSTLIKQ